MTLLQVSVAAAPIDSLGDCRPSPGQTGTGYQHRRMWRGWRGSTGSWQCPCRRGGWRWTGVWRCRRQLEAGRCRQMGGRCQKVGGRCHLHTNFCAHKSSSGSMQQDQVWGVNPKLTRISRFVEYLAAHSPRLKIRAAAERPGQYISARIPASQTCLRCRQRQRQHLPRSWPPRRRHLRMQRLWLWPAGGQASSRGAT